MTATPTGNCPGWCVAHDVSAAPDEPLLHFGVASGDGPSLVRDDALSTGTQVYLRDEQMSPAEAIALGKWLVLLAMEALADDAPDLEIPSDLYLPDDVEALLAGAQ